MKSENSWLGNDKAREVEVLKVRQWFSVTIERSGPVETKVVIKPSAACFKY